MRNWVILLFTAQGFFGIQDADAESRKIWIDGEAARYSVESFLSEQPELRAAFKEAAQQLRGVEIESGVDAMTVRVFLHRDVDLQWIPVKSAKRGQIYRVQMPQSWSVRMRLSDGIAHVSELKQVQLFAKVPALSDRFWVDRAVVDLNVSKATFWVRAVSGAVGLIASVDFARGIRVDIRWWNSLMFNFGAAAPARVSP